MWFARFAWFAWFANKTDPLLYELSYCKYALPLCKKCVYMKVQFSFQVDYDLFNIKYMIYILCRLVSSKTSLLWDSHKEGRSNSDLILRQMDQNFSLSPSFAVFSLALGLGIMYLVPLAKLQIFSSLLLI